MAVVDELIRINEDGTISFGNYKLDSKSKLDNFEHNGDIYKVKTFREITKLEKNGKFVYESVPGTTVHHLVITDDKVEMKIEGMDDPQITLELEPESEYKVYVDNASIGSMKTNISGKLNLSVEIGGADVAVKIVKI